MNRRKVANNPKGSSKIHGIAMYDETWRKFKEFKDYYDLPGDAAIEVLLNNWSAVQLDPETKDFIKRNARNTHKELTKEQKIKRAKMMSSHDTLKKHGLIQDNGTVKPVNNIFEDDPIKFDKFI